MKNYMLRTLATFILVTPGLFAQANVSSASPTPVTPSPVSEEARKHFVMGRTLFTEAKTADDFLQAQAEFKQAADLAPQWPEARYNLAVAKEAAGDYSGAMVELKLYQGFKLSESEARAVQDKIYVLEAKAGVAARKQATAIAEQKENAEKLAKWQSFLAKLRGSWYGAQECDAGGLRGGCNQQEYDGHNWRNFGTSYQFEVQNDGTLKISASYAIHAGCHGEVFGGPPDHPDILSDSDIRWEERPKDGPAREIYSHTLSDGSGIEISCDRPRLKRDDDDTRYHFVALARH